MEEIMNPKTNTAFRYLSIYAIVNVVYILLVFGCTFIYVGVLADAFGVLFFSFFFYVEYFLMVLHIVYFIAYLIIFMIKFIRAKCIRNIVFTVIISTLGLFLNIGCWQNFGEMIS